MTPASSNACTSRCTAFTSRPTRRAISRIDSGPVAVMALMMFQRICVSVWNSSSGDSNVMYAPCALPSNAAKNRLLTVSREATPSVTVFMMGSSYLRQSKNPRILYRHRLSNHSFTKFFGKCIRGQDVYRDAKQLCQLAPDRTDIQQGHPRFRVNQDIQITVLRIFPAQDRTKYARIDGAVCLDNKPDLSAVRIKCNGRLHRTNSSAV